VELKRLNQLESDGGRLRNRTENLLADWLDDPRAAVALAPFISDAALADCTVTVEEAVVIALVNALEERSGEAVVEYCGGERRDLLRSAALREG
jgi:hypothetical protein